MLVILEENLSVLVLCQEGMVLVINRNKLIEESIYSFQCPDNLIIRIIN